MIFVRCLMISNFNHHEDAISKAKLKEDVDGS